MADDGFGWTAGWVGFELLGGVRLLQRQTSPEDQLPALAEPALLLLMRPRSAATLVVSCHWPAVVYCRRSRCLTKGAISSFIRRKSRLALASRSSALLILPPLVMTAYPLLCRNARHSPRTWRPLSGRDCLSECRARIPPANTSISASSSSIITGNRKLVKNETTGRSSCFANFAKRSLRVEWP